jgi:2-(1,2-epoxy-1,2-dihydrophenyl)acetyl-CoA isomerase
MSEDVLYEKRPDGVALITLNRPDSLNAMGGDLMPMLADFLGQATWDQSVRCVVLTGAGRAFCAGGDVKGMGSRPAGLPASAATDGQKASFLQSLEFGAAGLRKSQMETSYVLHTMPKPTIAMVNGHAVGAGLSLALACDLRIASDRGKFGTAFRNIALSGDYGGTFYMTRLIGAGKTRELYFTAEIIDAAEALRLGMVNRVVPHDDLMNETMALAAKLASGPTATFAKMKENLNLAEHGDLRTLMHQEGFNQRLTGLSNDSREAVQAFIEKREPKFAGG